MMLSQHWRIPEALTDLPFISSFYEIFTDHPGNHSQHPQKYGRVIKTTNTGKTTYLTDSPDVALVALTESANFTKKIDEDHPLWDIEDNISIFIKNSENENWRLTHKFLPPVMDPKAMKHHRTWNVYQFMAKLASQTVAKFALGTVLKQFESSNTPSPQCGNEIVNLLALNKIVVARGEWYHFLPFGNSARLEIVQKTIYEYHQ
ncbi:monooxygenase-like protein [Thermochaetoides thermophila DSM 1495]|uniref:Monooxygenase-like protein n=1 Tax=Chaetomium thermophilum (strain DSM 1495 / CBS 144.50 / IMI 039719) TaxID=759272 RepID=G0S4N2_CHATD|nr:monooxygenase-like protein [Thermochaetoides thermophila DSM 1495]EGS21307.1 monooxygenase-like protein [Thermochaetoides thermophila DSM 1495]